MIFQSPWNTLLLWIRLAVRGGALVGLTAVASGAVVQEEDSSVARKPSAFFDPTVLDGLPGERLTTGVSIRPIRAALLRLEYVLIGEDGEVIHDPDTSFYSWTFSIYQGDREIESGKFGTSPAYCRTYDWVVPPSASGDLCIVARCDASEAGHLEARPVQFRWSWMNHLWLLAPLLLLAPALALRCNRDWRAWAGLLPASLLYLLTLPFHLGDSSGPFPFASAGEGNSLSLIVATFSPLPVALGLFLLLTPWFDRLAPRRAFIAALLVLLGVVFWSVGCYFGFHLEEIRLLRSTFLRALVLGLVVVCALALARVHCRRGFTSGRLAVGFFWWSVILGLGVAVAWLCSELGWRMLGMEALFSLILGLVLCLILLAMTYPILLLALASDFHHPRIEPLFRRPSREGSTPRGS